MNYDVIIIGKGPAGISAGLYTARANLKTLVIGKDSWLNKTEKIDNYYGFPETITGVDLLKRGENQIKKFGVKILNEEVMSIEIMYETQEISIKTNDSEFICKALLIATGQNRKKFNVKNIEKFDGKGIHYCTTCDGFFYKNKKVAIVGNADYAINEMKELLKFSDDVQLFTNGKELELSKDYLDILKKVNINKSKIKEFEGNERLEKIKFEDDSFQNIDGIFIAEQSANASDFAKKIGIVLNNNKISVNSNQETNINGIFAAGDCTSDFMQIAVAVGQGAIAGKSIIDYLKK